MFFAALLSCVLLAGAFLPDAEEPIVHSGIVEAPIAEVWDAWTTSAGIVKWMAPAGEVELKIGGKYRTSYTKGSDLTGPDVIENTILAFDPQRMLAFKNTRAPENFPFKKALDRAWTVIYLEPVDEKSTRVTVKMLGFGDDPESKSAREFFEKGNAFTLEALTTLFRGA
jgi:uncharacterized protein YndB with AHSA1/START domain